MLPADRARLIACLDEPRPENLASRALLFAGAELEPPVLEKFKRYFTQCSSAALAKLAGIPLVQGLPARRKLWRRRRRSRERRRSTVEQPIFRPGSRFSHKWSCCPAVPAAEHRTRQSLPACFGLNHSVKLWSNAWSKLLRWEIHEGS